MRKRTRFLLCFMLFFSARTFAVAQVTLPQTLLVADSGSAVNENYLTAGKRTTTYYDLGCKHQGWDGYFAPNRWFITVVNGDGGVDVTEAPDPASTEGVEAARLDVQTEGKSNYTWRITVPADGYLYFRLEKVGSFLSPRLSSTDTSLQIIHNEKSSPLEPLSDGSYFSPHLRAGDTFGIRFGSNSRFNWHDLIFYSNSVGVVVKSFSDQRRAKEWIADEVNPIPRASVDQLVFLDNAPESWPLIDLDGNLETIDDQISLKDAGDLNPLIIEQRDSPQLHEGQYWIRREFEVKEPCSGTTLKINRWWQPLPLLPPASVSKFE